MTKHKNKKLDDWNKIWKKPSRWKMLGSNRSENGKEPKDRWDTDHDMAAFRLFVGRWITTLVWIHWQTKMSWKDTSRISLIYKKQKKEMKGEITTNVCIKKSVDFSLTTEEHCNQTYPLKYSSQKYQALNWNTHVSLLSTKQISCALLLLDKRRALLVLVSIIKTNAS